MSDPRVTVAGMNHRGKKHEEKKQLSDDARLALLARDQFGLISRTQALAEGMASTTIDRRLREEVWLRARPGVYRFAAVPPSWEQSLMAVCLQIPGSVAYGRTAGWLHGLDGLGKSPPTQHEIAVARSQHPRCADISLFRIRNLEGQWTNKFVIPATHLPRTLIDLAGMLKPSDAELALDSALRSRPALKSWLGQVLATYPPNCG